MRLACFLFALLLLSGCKSNRPTPPDTTTHPENVPTLTSGGESSAIIKMAESLKPCPNEASLAALNVVYPTLGHIDATSASSLTAAEKSIACLRPWAEALTDECQKEAMLGWLEHYEGQIKYDRDALKSGTAENEQDKWERERRETERKVRNYERAHPFPKMPQCESK
jgi:hypothetical protein